MKTESKFLDRKMDMELKLLEGEIKSILESKFLEEEICTSETVEAIRSTVNDLLMKKLIYGFEPKFTLEQHDRTTTIVPKDLITGLLLRGVDATRVPTNATEWEDENWKYYYNDEEGFCGVSKNVVPYITVTGTVKL